MAKKETEVPQQQSKDRPNSGGHWARRLVYWTPTTKMAEVQAEVDTLWPSRDALSLLVAGLSMVAFHGEDGGCVPLASGEGALAPAEWGGRGLVCLSGPFLCGLRVSDSGGKGMEGSNFEPSRWQGAG